MTIQNDYDNYNIGTPIGQNSLVTGDCSVINSGEGATRTLLASESGAICMFDRAAGIVYTLPATCPIGTRFEFRTTVSVTSNAAKVITGSASQFLVGGVISGSATIAEGGGFWAANGSTHVAISSNGSTTGGLIGDAYSVTRISSTQWAIEGIISGSGTIVTPFATS